MASISVVDSFATLMVVKGRLVRSTTGMQRVPRRHDRKIFDTGTKFLIFQGHQVDEETRVYYHAKFQWPAFWSNYRLYVKPWINISLEYQCFEDVFAYNKSIMCYKNPI